MTVLNTLNFCRGWFKSSEERAYVSHYAHKFADVNLKRTHAHKNRSNFKLFKQQCFVCLYTLSIKTNLNCQNMLL